MKYMYKEQKGTTKKEMKSTFSAYVYTRTYGHLPSVFQISLICMGINDGNYFIIEQN